MLFFQNMFLPLYNNKEHVCTSISVQYLKRKVCIPVRKKMTIT